MHSELRVQLIRHIAWTVVFIHSLALPILGCGGAASDVQENQGFRVALLTPGPVSDQSWNAAAYDGLMRIRDSLGATVRQVQTRTPAEFEENYRQYGASGYSLVIGHGFEFQEAAQRVAPAYPQSIFATTGGTGVGPNIAAMSFAFDEPSYLAGMAAAGVSKSKILAVIGGTELPPVRASFDAFVAGAKAIDPSIRVRTAFLGNWDDAGAGKEQALALIARGADVIFQNADAAGQGIFQAVRESRGVWIIGSNADQNALAPDVTLGSVVIDIPHAFLLLADEVKSGRFAPRVVRFATASDVVRWVPNPAVSAIPPSLASRIDSTRAAFAADRGPTLAAPQ
ncbi:MAG: BMP family protein [Gemmatimonadaceae bacterium]|nr:BMP family protein [Gemmatimonadaceae bacterium]MCW5826989.1 BMP family protein [Gemmatimonadaceae bacterium]